MNPQVIQFVIDEIEQSPALLRRAVEGLSDEQIRHVPQAAARGVCSVGGD